MVLVLKILLKVFVPSLLTIYQYNAARVIVCDNSVLYVLQYAIVAWFR